MILKLWLKAKLPPRYPSFHSNLIVTAVGPWTCLLLSLTFQNCFLKTSPPPPPGSPPGLSHAEVIRLFSGKPRISPTRLYPWGLSPTPHFMRPAQCLAGTHKDEWWLDKQNQMNIKHHRCLLPQSGGHTWWRRRAGSRPGGLHWGRQGSPGQRPQQCWPGNFRWTL